MARNLFSSGDFASIMLYKAQLMLRMNEKFYLLSLLLVLILYLSIRMKRFRAMVSYVRASEEMRFLCIACTFYVAIHFVPGYILKEYFVIILPLAALFLGRVFCWLQSGRSSGELALDVRVCRLLLICAALFQVFLGYNHLWPVYRTSPVEIRKLAAYVSLMAGKQGRVFTYYPEIEVEANVPGVEGLEMGRDSIFPHWATDRCLKLRKMNCELIEDLLQNGRDVVLVLASAHGNYEFGEKFGFHQEESARLAQLVKTNFFPTREFEVEKGGTVFTVYLNRQKQAGKHE